MNSFPETLISVAVGAALTVLGSFILERTKRKSDRVKFSFEKIINVGEQFYNYSGLSILTIEATLRYIESNNRYDNENSITIYQQVVKKFGEISENFASSTITITCANIYYGVSNVNTASNAMAGISKALADFHNIEKDDTQENNERRRDAFENIKNQYKDLISIIKTDRGKIEEQIRILMKIPAFDD